MLKKKGNQRSEQDLESLYEFTRFNEFLFVEGPKIHYEITTIMKYHFEKQRTMLFRYGKILDTHDDNPDRLTPLDEFGSNCYILVKGQLEAYNGGWRRTLEPGSVIGDKSLYLNIPIYSNYICVTDCHFIAIERVHYKEIVCNTCFPLCLVVLATSLICM